MKMFCIVSREALKAMNGNRGKLAAQAGHAYLHAYWDAEERFPRGEASDPEYDPLTGGLKKTITPPAHREYRYSGKAKKVCLVVETTAELSTLCEAYRPVCGVSLVTDAGLTCFDGPTTTCLGIGPIRDEDVGDDLKVLKVLI